ncbi:MAG TPA: prolyl oligopeptidase family serine peptidase [Steroidobacteraceae bacterium]|nr:prolyl oligopeptidase family serine peptidase [Steroidobacteraceae bacterium]
MTRTIARLAAGLTLTAVCSIATAQTPAALTVERIVSQPPVTGTPPSAVAWSPDSKRVAFLWNDAAGQRRDIWIVEAAGKTASRVTTETSVTAGISEFAWTPDAASLIFLSGEDLWRLSLDAARKADRIATIGGEASNLAVAPNGAYASFLKGGDLWLANLASDEVVQATHVGVPFVGTVALGTYARPDVEIGPYVWGGPTYSWSPDSRTIAVHYVDRRKVRKVPFPSYLGKETQPNEMRRAYPGDPNEHRTVGLLSVASRELELLDLPGPTENRIADFSWSAQTGQLLIDRESDTSVDRWLDVIDPRSGARTQIWHDSRDTRIYNTVGSAWHPDGKRVVFLGDLADRYGLYLLTPGSKATPKLLTDARFDVTAGPYVADRALYYQSNEPSPYERHVFRIADGGGTATRITKLAGDNQPFVSPDGSSVAFLHSDDSSPLDLYLADSRGSAARRITTSPPPEFRDRQWARARYVTFPSRIDNYTLHARVVEPRTLEPGRKYPVIFGAVYLNTVRNHWMIRHYGALQQLLVERGYIVVQVDVRGSTGYGRAFREEFLGDFAGGDLDDLESAATYLKALPYVDATRMGIFGSSYGGTLTMYSLLKKPGLFKAGVACAAAVDPHFFGPDDVAIVRRPDSLPAAFERGAAQYAGNLQDHLLIIHGMADDVVPFKTIVSLADELMLQDKDFDFAFAPGATHNWMADPDDARYLLNKLVAHFDRYLQQ